jgi:DNA-binding transcriptional LysR family regulator
MGAAENEHVETWTLLRGKERQTIEVSPRIVVNDHFALREIAADGAGIAALPKYLFDPTRLERVLPKWELAPAELHAIYASRRGRTPKLKAFLDFLAAYMPERLRTGDM